MVGAVGSDGPPRCIARYQSATGAPTIVPDLVGSFTINGHK